jgi:predicted MPP superfamily phosphohydrolase
VLADALWWWRADVRVRKLARGSPPRRWGRVALAAFMLFQFSYLLWFVVFPDEARRSYGWMPMPLLAAVYAWHLLVLPILLVVEGVALVVRGATKLVRRRGDVETDKTILSRRAAIAAGLAAIPPLITAGTVVASMRQLREFRIRRITVPLPQLPEALDGMTIAQVSDVHVGRFTRAAMLPKIADATNQLQADLVLLTGDLIDISLSDLPLAIDFVRTLDPRSGLVLCEGNHDLIDDRFLFEYGVRRAGLTLLLDEAMTVLVRDHPVQLLGLSWDRGSRGIESSMRTLQPHRRPDEFQILLAHHPHAFDPAAAAGIPLTLSGHTHGGQLMLNERLGAGPVMFRYWSGLYRQGDSSLVVSNGVGNWFPLRTHAPAEIVHITLRRAV